MKRINSKLYVLNFKKETNKGSNKLLIPKEYIDKFWYFLSDGTMYINSQEETYPGSVSIMKFLMKRSKIALQKPDLFIDYLKSFYKEHAYVNDECFWRKLIEVNNYHVVEHIFKELVIIESKRRDLFLQHKKTNKIVKKVK